VPWFRKNRKALELYCDMPDFGGASGAYYKYCRLITEKFTETDVLSIESKKLEKRSAEYCSYIIEAIELDKIFRLNGNVRNDALITNLPNGCCVEVPIYVDSMGLHPTVVGSLPPQCAALNMTNVLVQGLAVEAATKGDPELAMQAVSLDPLTSAVCTLHEVREMVREMIDTEAKWLPQFGGKRLASVPVISIPVNTVPVQVPQDPALAIAGRFGKLATS
jgi:alpha-galactosidase